MIGVAIGDMLPFAAAVAASPVQIMAVIALLFSAHARRNGSLFAGGWLIGLFGMTAAITLLVDGAGVDTDERVHDVVSWIQVLLGLGLLFLALRQWLKRPAGGEPEAAPEWLSAVDQLSSARVFRLALVMVLLDPVNLMMAASVGALIGEGEGLSTADGLLVVLVFTVIASVTIFGPVLYYLAGGESARRRLDDLRQWLSRHSTAVTTAVLVVIGAALLGEGISELSA